MSAKPIHRHHFVLLFRNPTRQVVLAWVERRKGLLILAATKPITTIPRRQLSFCDWNLVLTSTLRSRGDTSASQYNNSPGSGEMDVTGRPQVPNVCSGVAAISSPSFSLNSSSFSHLFAIMKQKERKPVSKNNFLLSLLLLLIY